MYHMKSNSERGKQTTTDKLTSNGCIHSGQQDNHILPIARPFHLLVLLCSDFFVSNDSSYNLPAAIKTLFKSIARCVMTN